MVLVFNIRIVCTSIKTLPECLVEVILSLTTDSGLKKGKSSGSVLVGHLAISLIVYETERS